MSDDDIIDISFDEDEPRQRPDDSVLEVNLEQERGSKRPQATPKATSADSEADLPMVSSGVCPRCGYALRPLETECPRCTKQGPTTGLSPVSATEAPTTPLPEVDRGYPVPASNRGCVVGWIIGAIVLLAVIIGVPLAIWMQPAQRAKREYELGLQAQIRADFERARSHYQRALEIYPNMGLAAFSMGTTYLHVGDPALVQSMQQAVEQASQGHTEELDQADEWFRKALEIGQRLPVGERLADQKIRTPAHLRAFARACLALTAFIRASAALQADQFEQASAWLAVAHREAQAAIIDDPQNPSAQQILRTVDPMVPPSSQIP
jgi:hypothetical protein